MKTDARKYEGFAEIDPKFVVMFEGRAWPHAIIFYHRVECANAQTVEFLKKAIVKAGGKLVDIVQTDRMQRERFLELDSGPFGRHRKRARP